jgi:hypothetical protein
MRQAPFGYPEGMEAPEHEGSDVTDLYDDLEEGLACRVCGVLVPRVGSYAQAHWDWHEATNGA